MSLKVIKIHSDTHRLLAIQSRVLGEKIQDIAERAVRSEIDRLTNSCSKPITETETNGNGK
jgi:hypothetical protein